MVRMSTQFYCVPFAGMFKESTKKQVMSFRETSKADEDILTVSRTLGTKVNSCDYTGESQFSTTHHARYGKIRR